MTRFVYFLSVTYAFVLASSPAVSADETTVAGQDGVIETVTIIGRKTDIADVPGSAHVIDSEELEIHMQADILRVLRTVPGVYLQEEEGYGLRPNIGIRGSGLDRSARIALLEDGVLIAPAPYAAPSAYYFPTQRRMSALEVLKGPAAVVVGPRTTGGAINMISTPIPDVTGGALDLRVGEHGGSDAHVNFGARGEQFSWLLETVQSTSDGFKTIAGPRGGDTGFELEDYLVKLQFDNDPTAAIHHSLRLKVGYTDQLSDETYLGLTDADFAADPYQRYAASTGDNIASDHQQYRVTWVVDTDRWRGTVTAYRNEFARNWYKLQSVNGTGISRVLDDPATYALELGYLKGESSTDDALVKRANNRTYLSQGLQAQLDFGFSIGDADATLTAGVRLHEDEEDRFQHEDGYRMDDGVLTMTSAGAPGSTTNRVASAEARSLFIDTEIRAGRWVLTPGMRFEDIDMQRLDFSTVDPARSSGPTRVRDNGVSVWIPGFGALFRVNEDLRLLAGVHRGFNPPAPGSSASEETSTNVELGARYSAGGLSFESIWFYNDYDNLVGTVTESTGGGVVGEQFDGGKVLVSGLELSAARAFRAGSLTVPVALDYTWTSKAEFRSAFESNFDPWGTVAVGDELPYIPEHQLTLNVGLRSEQWRLNVSGSYLGSLRTKAGQGALDPAESIGSHVVWDVVASWQFSERLAGYVKADNVLDETYVAARRPAGLRPGLPRTAYLGLTYQL